jgi:hypothetical protein
MSNTCHVWLRIIGERNDIVAAEQDLANVFSHTWNSDRGHDFSVWPTIDGVVFQTWYPWNPPGKKLDEIFAQHERLVFLVDYWETGCGFRGRVVWDHQVDIGGTSPQIPGADLSIFLVLRE